MHTYCRIKHPELFVHVTKTDSTMSDARDILSKLNPALESLLVIADEQFGGKGRNNNQWLSPKGGLWFTYCVKSTSISYPITLVLGLILYEVLSNQYPELNLRLKIKWPNDIIFDNQKLSGILVQSYNNYLCMGIGLNTNNDVSLPEVPFPPVSLKQILGFELSNRAILKTFLKHFHKIYPKFVSDGLNPFRSEINHLLYGLNRQIEFDNNETIIIGTCRGISEEGALLIENNLGELLPYYSGSIIKVNA